MVALPTSLFASGFAHVMSRDQKALEDAAREAAADGIVTDEEADAFSALAEQLYVEPEFAGETLAAAQRKKMIPKGSDCPHCGKWIEP